MISTPDSILDEVLSERLRQINRHGYTVAHDDGHQLGELARAAASYAVAGAGFTSTRYWPFERFGWHLWKPGDVRKIASRRRCCIKAMALLAAEVEMIDRHEACRG